jgi:hypothetical protein
MGIRVIRTPDDAIQNNVIVVAQMDIRPSPTTFPNAFSSRPPLHEGSSGLKEATDVSLMRCSARLTPDPARVDQGRKCSDLSPLTVVNATRDILYGVSIAALGLLVG